MAAQTTTTTTKSKGPLFERTFGKDYEKERELRKAKEDAAAAAKPKPAPKSTVRRPTGREEMIQRNIARAKERAKPKEQASTPTSTSNNTSKPRTKQPKGDPVDVRSTRRGTDFGGAGNAEIQGKAVEGYARQKKKELEGQSNIVGS